MWSTNIECMDVSSFGKQIGLGCASLRDLLGSSCPKHGALIFDPLLLIVCRPLKFAPHCIARPYVLSEPSCRLSFFAAAE